MWQTSMWRTARAWALRATVVIGALVAARRDFVVPELPAVRAKAVVRWEYRPGSALFLVWQQGRDETGDFDGAYDLQRNYRRLFRSHPDNTLLVKASYWLSL